MARFQNLTPLAKEAEICLAQPIPSGSAEESYRALQGVLSGDRQGMAEGTLQGYWFAMIDGDIFWSGPRSESSALTFESYLLAPGSLSSCLPCTARVPCRLWARAGVLSLVVRLCGAVRCGVVWSGAEWCGVAWCGWS